MLRKILSIALLAIGLVVIALAIASATVWRDSETVTASLPADPAVPLVVTEPGVLDVVASDVTVTASAPDGSPVVLIVGRELDVVGWVGDAGHVLVTGLGSWTELATTVVDGPGELPSPAGSDMWVAQATGDGEATLDWSSRSGRWSLLAATDGSAPAPQLSLTWQREVSTPFLIPGLVVGAIVLLGGVALGFVAMRRPPQPVVELDRDAIRERLGAIPPRRKPGRHAHGTRPSDTYAGTEVAGAAAAVGAGTQGSAPAAGEVQPGSAGPVGEDDGAAGAEEASDESAEVALADSDAADADADGEGDEPGAVLPEDVRPSLEEGEAEEADQADADPPVAEFDRSKSETDEGEEDEASPAGDDTVTVAEIDPKGKKS